VEAEDGDPSGLVEAAVGERDVGQWRPGEAVGVEDGPVGPEDDALRVVPDVAAGDHEATIVDVEDLRRGPRRERGLGQGHPSPGARDLADRRCVRTPDRVGGDGRRADEQGE
jgi:hypothetical protein